MSKLFRQIGREAPKLFRQIRRDTDVIGRKITNTTRDIDRGLDQAKRITSGIERGASMVPVVGGVVGGVSRTLGQALDVAKTTNSAVGNVGMGTRDLAAGRLADAGAKFERAGTQGLQAATQGSNIVSDFFIPG